MPSRTTDLTGHVFVIACSLAITLGLVATTGVLLAAAAFTTTSTLAIPLIATFEGFLDAGGTNAVTVTGSWTMAGALTIAIAALLSFVLLRRAGRRGPSSRPPLPS